MTIKKKELLAIIQYIEHDKGIEKSVVADMICTCLKQAIQKTLHLKGVDVVINPLSGDLKISCLKEVVPDSKEIHPHVPVFESSVSRNISNRKSQDTITVSQAHELAPQADVGDFIRLSVGQTELCRTTASMMWQLLQQKSTQLSKEALFHSYQDRVGETVTGIVKSVYNNKSLLVDIGKLCAILPYNHYPKKEVYNIGNRICAVLLKIHNHETGNNELILSRTAPEFFISLLKRDVPELKDQTVVINKIARIPGVCTKLVVSANDDKVDAVGSILGPRGSRIQNIYKELQGERVDVLLHTDNLKDLLIQANAPLTPVYIYLSEESNKCTLVVQDTDFPGTIGREGAGIRLKEQLIDKPIEVFRLTAFILLLNEMLENISMLGSSILQIPVHRLPVHRLILDNLIAYNCKTIGDISTKTVNDLLSIDGISLEVLHEIIRSIEKLSPQ